MCVPREGFVPSQKETFWAERHGNVLYLQGNSLVIDSLSFVFSKWLKLPL